MASEEIDDLVLEGHGGAIHDPSHLDDPNAGKQEALAARLKCEIIKISEEAAKARKIRVSLIVAQCVTELTMDYAEHFAKDILAFSKHRKGKTIALEDVKLAIRKLPRVEASVEECLPEELRTKRPRQTTLT